MAGCTPSLCSRSFTAEPLLPRFSRGTDDLLSPQESFTIRFEYFENIIAIKNPRPYFIYFILNNHRRISRSKNVSMHFHPYLSQQKLVDDSQRENQSNPQKQYAFQRRVTLLHFPFCLSLFLMTLIGIVGNDRSETTNYILHNVSPRCTEGRQVAYKKRKSNDSRSLVSIQWDIRG